MSEHVKQRTQLTRTKVNISHSNIRPSIRPKYINFGGELQV